MDGSGRDGVRAPRLPWCARRPRLALAVLALAAAAATGPPPAEALTPTAAQDGERAGGRDGGDLDALVLGRAGSPALRAMRDVADLDTVRRASIGRLRPHRYDMLIVDGDQLTPGELRRRAALQRFVGANKWIAAFDVRPSDHEALRTYTGFDVADGNRSDRSELLLFGVSLAQGTPTVEIVDSGPLGEGIPRAFGDGRTRRLKRGHARRVARLVESHVATGDASAAQAQTVACPPLTPPPDADLQHVGWCYTDAGQRAVPEGFWTQAQKRWWIDSYAIPGSQTATWTMNHRFDVFLNNDPAHPQGNFQTVTYGLNGQFTPKRPAERFFRMFEKFSSGWHGTRSVERAWWTGLVDVQITPDNATDAKLRWQASHPESANAETSYSSGEEFSIGFNGTLGNLQNVAGGGISVGYTSSNSKNYSIPDWGVQSRTSGNDLAWTFSARHPCDTRLKADRDSCFDKQFGFVGPFSPAMPNELSRGQLQVNASARWRTTQHLTAPNDRLAFAVRTPVNLVDTYCDGEFLGGWCGAGRSNFRYQKTGPADDSLTINAGWVNPIPIKELRLAPNPANGAKAEKVTGTVVLEKAPPVPVNVRILSNSDNAVVGGPLTGVSGGSQKTITIEAGKSSGTFTVNTNDNRLNAGQRTTANITAFYTEPTTEQLRIERP